MNTPTILIVDDMATNVEIVQSVLASEGFRTLTANDGPSARVLSRTEQPDLILLDVVMPGETGFETCARLKSDPATADIPIIFLSALDDVKSKVTGLKIGGVDYVPKPVNGEEVLARVRVHLRIRETNRILVQKIAHGSISYGAPSRRSWWILPTAPRRASRFSTSRLKRPAGISTMSSSWIPGCLAILWRMSAAMG